MQRKTITTNAILHTPIGHLSKYPLDQLIQFLSDAATELEAAERTKQWIEFVISLKCQKSIRTKRLHMNRGIGIVHIKNCGSYKLTKLGQKQYHNKNKIN